MMTAPAKEALLHRRLVLCFALSAAALAICEASRRDAPLTDFEARSTAAQTVVEAESLLKAEKQRRQIHINPLDDPAGAGVIGPKFSPIVTDTSTVEVKRIAANPNLAAAVVGMLGELRVGPGDPVAICMTGSMPGANLSVLAAVQAIGAKPTIIASVGPSMWGATDPEFTWLDMAAALQARGLLQAMPVAATPGGPADSARGLSPAALKLMRASAVRTKTPLVVPTSLDQAVQLRMNAFHKAPGGRPKAFINVGGGAASYGTAFNSATAPGPVIQPDVAGKLQPSGVIYLMLSRGVPVINLHQIGEMARDLGLPADYTAAVSIGEPKQLYYESRRPMVVLVAVTVGLLALLAILLRIGGIVPLAATRENVPTAAQEQPNPSEETRP